MAYQKRNLVFSLFWALKTPFLGKIGAKIQNFEDSNNIPLDNLEIHVVSEFGPVPMKMVAGILSEHKQRRQWTFQYPSIPYTQVTNLLTYPTSPPTIIHQSVTVRNPSKNNTVKFAPSYTTEK